MGPQQIASIVEGGIGLTAATAGAIYGGIKSGKLNRQAEKILQQQKKDNQNWYDVKMSSDYTQRADVQAAMYSIMTGEAEEIRKMQELERAEMDEFRRRHQERAERMKALEEALKAEEEGKEL